VILRKTTSIQKITLNKGTTLNNKKIIKNHRKTTWIKAETTSTNRDNIKIKNKSSGQKLSVMTPKKRGRSLTRIKITLSADRSRIKRKLATLELLNFWSNCKKKSQFV
jgi:hypothetical protein